MEQVKTYLANFADPQLLWLLLVVPLLAAWYIWRNNSLNADLRFSSLDTLNSVRNSPKHLFRHAVFVLRMAAIASLVIALARPQSSTSFKTINSEGIDIVIAMDISASMLARDFKPNRLEASKQVASEFIDSRPDDHIGLVIFSGESFTQCPLTIDHSVIKNMFGSIQTGMIEDGTAIGMGLANAVARIKDSKAKSKVIILLTDGVNNAGTVAPLTAADVAKTFGVRVYTIGVGTEGKAFSPVSIDPFGNYQFDYVDVKIDEPVLKKIAEMTDGKYFRATDNNSLRTIYKEIDKLEKTIFEEKSFTRKAEEFLPWLIAAGIALLLEFFLRSTVLKSIT